MSDSDHGEGHFNPEKVFVLLFILTALEVMWGYAGYWLDWGRLMLWGGLLFFAFYKAWLIAVYFMHLKFEGWVVKSLLAPTPLLVVVILGYVMADVGDKTRMVHPIGSMLDPETGNVHEDIAEIWSPPNAEGDEEH